MTAPAAVDVEEAAKWVESLALVRAHRHQQTVVAALIRHQAEQIRDLQERLDAEGPKFDARASKWLEQIAELRNMVSVLWMHQDDDDWQDDFVARVKSAIASQGGATAQTSASPIPATSPDCLP